MPFRAILDEVDHLDNVSKHLEGLAEHHLSVSDELIRIAVNVRSTATLLAVVVATKMQDGDGQRV